MDKLMLTMIALFGMGIIWIIFEVIQAVKEWIKKEREAIFKDE